MRILHVIARLNVGGAALSVLELAAAQQARGHQVLVVAGTIPDEEASMEHLAPTLGVEYLKLPALRRELSIRSDTAAIRSLRRLLRRDRPDVLHTHTAKAGATGRLAALTAGAGRPSTIVHTYHGHVLTGYFDSRRERVFRAVERALAHSTNTLVAVSDEVRDDLVRLHVAPTDKFVVVPYGFDLDARVGSVSEHRADLRRELGVSDSTFVVGWAGRLTAIKRPEDLVRTIALVPDAVLVIVGDGEQANRVRSVAHELGVQERVKLLGYRDEIGPWYSTFDAFLLTSANEGTPVVAIEALAAGVPVVATRAGGTATVVDDGETGLLIEVGDVAALAAALATLEADAGLRARFAEQGARRMRDRFSVERMADRIEEVYAR